MEISDESPRVVRLDVDYGVKFPLWGQYGLTDESDWELSPALVADLKQWCAEFDRGYHHDYGWSSRKNLERHRDALPGLAERLSAELPGWRVEPEFWATSVCGESDS